MSSGVDLTVLGAMSILFIIVTIWIGYKAYKSTSHNDEDYLLGRKKSSPFIIALSYGATFLSASAVIGFGGQAAVHGLSLMWLCFLNLFVGVLISFIVFGKRTRRIGTRLKASTFAELLGKIYDSKFIRLFTAVIIVAVMPIYAAAVLKGCINSLVVLTGLQEFQNIILIGLILIVGLYVVYGGIIAVMYNDALQAGILLVGMVVILVITFTHLGGIEQAFSQLDFIWSQKQGDAGLGVLDGFNGWTSTPDFGSGEWMTVFSSFVLGVGLGAITQPQLAVRFMSAKNDSDLDKSVFIGTLFIFIIVGSAYTIGPLSNVFFYYGDSHMISFEYIQSLGLGVDFIIPQFILELFHDMSFGDLFVSLFILTLISAAISTISALLHTIGAAGGYDIYSMVRKKNKKINSVITTRFTIVMIMLIIVCYCYVMPADIIAWATGAFMGLTASALLPTYFHALYSKRPSKPAAICSVIVGSVAYAVFMSLPDEMIFHIDPILISLPLSAFTMAIVLFFLHRFGEVRESLESD